MTSLPVSSHAPACCGTHLCRTSLAIRVGLTALLVAAYYGLRGSLIAAVGESMDLATVRTLWALALLAGVLAVWGKIILRDKRYHAPLLVTIILALSDASFAMLENHPAPPWLVAATGGLALEYSPTFLTMAITVLCELLIGRFYWGKWPHPASAYVSGISAGILVKSPALWPFVMCGLIAISSKYVLRIGNRHLWNPTNLGMTVMLLLAPQHVASLGVQAGNNGLAILLIWFLGGLIMWNLDRFHMPLAFIAAFVPLSFLRSAVTGHPWQTEIAPITSPMFQLFIFFMITDPKTTIRGKWNQTVFVVVVAIAETALRLVLRDVHSLYHSLFIVGPIANLMEIVGDRAKANRAAMANRPAVEAREPALEKV